jgi:pimeloyl-ACP methyl ester carboxylesterase
MKRLNFQVQKDIVIQSAAGRPMAFDLYWPEETRPCPLILFAHGFKGFKDWGHWGLIAETFARHGFAFLPFNFSHNGVTPEYPVDFADLEAFGHNNFTKELQDIDTLLDALFQRPAWLPASISLDHLGLIGHSRGGALAIIAAARDPRIQALATWAAVQDLSFLWHNAYWLEEWKQKGVIFIPNARTGQEMPLYYQLYEDYQQHGDAYLVEAQLPQLPQPLLIAHGADDPGVPVAQARQLHAWRPDAQLRIIEGADHVFGGSHPFTEGELPLPSKILADTTMEFFSTNFKTL